MATDREPEALPEDSSLEDLKDHARTLHEAALAGESDARRRVEPYFDNPSSLKLRQAHLVIAREYGFASWRKLKSFVDIRDARAERILKLAMPGTRPARYVVLSVTSRNTKCANSSPAPAHSFASNASSCACRSYGMKLGNHHDLRAAG